MNPLEVIGLLLLCYIALKLLFWCVSWLARFCKSDVLRPEEGDYAIVTGATDGIGLEYARQLAQKGFSLLLLSRTEDKLKRVAQEIVAQFPQCKQVEVLAVDFSRSDIYDAIREKIDSLKGKVVVLVNNVGTVFHIPQFFAQYPPNYNRDLVNVNVLSVTLMCEIVLKVMLKHKRGIIINVSSFAGITIFPLFSTYSASKAYMNALGSAISSEYGGEGIIVQTLVPNQIKTKASKDLHQESVSVSTEAFVKSALKSVGKESLTSGHPKHKLLNSLALFVGDILGHELFMKFKLYAGRDARDKYNKNTQHKLEN